MKEKYKDRRIINIDKVAYDIIKSYCIKNALDMPKWIVKIVLLAINNKDV